MNGFVIGFPLGAICGAATVSILYAFVIPKLCNKKDGAE